MAEIQARKLCPQCGLFQAVWTSELNRNNGITFRKKRNQNTGVPSGECKCPLLTRPLATPEEGVIVNRTQNQSLNHSTQNTQKGNETVPSSSDNSLVIDLRSERLPRPPTSSPLSEVSSNQFLAQRQIYSIPPTSYNNDIFTEVSSHQSQTQPFQSTSPNVEALFPSPPTSPYEYMVPSSLEESSNVQSPLPPVHTYQVVGVVEDLLLDLIPESISAEEIPPQFNNNNGGCSSGNLPTTSTASAFTFPPPPQAVPAASNPKTKSKEKTCPVCGQVFVDQHLYRNHLEVHEGLKPFLCTVCGRGYETAIQLLDHFARHTSTPQFTCERCKKSYKTARGFASHDEKCRLTNLPTCG